MLLNPGRKTITQSLVFAGIDDLDWSAAFKMFSRSEWNEKRLFDTIIRDASAYFDDGFISIAVDDTKVKKTGMKIPHAGYFHDPLSPHFHPNFLWGHRILQASVTLPLYQQYPEEALNEEDTYNASRGIPVWAINVPALKKPGKRATVEEIREYKIAKKTKNMSHAFVDVTHDLRVSFDEAGAADKRLLMVVDGSFCNKTVWKAEFDRTDVIARCRKDASLCFRAEGGTRRFYSTEKFSPHSVYQDQSIPYQEAKLIIGKKYRNVRYKDVKGVYWQRGAGRKELRLIVISPRPYKSSGRKQLYKRQAYLLTDNLTLKAVILIQQYINRWEIEVNHRDEKNNIGVGQAQVWNVKSVEKQPALLIAAYSVVLLASQKCFGHERGNDYLPLPKWRNGSTRPSCNDLLNLMR
ncbi:MAG: transposase, partial [Candidatus Cloacimonadaceae bacterium]|nr:transposase [Candidatus Cloacimonadaceae bacterium]